MRNLSIQKRLFLLITSFIVLTLAILSIVVYIYFFQNMKERELEFATRLSNETKQSIEIILQIVTNASISLSRDENILNALEKSVDDTIQEGKEDKHQINTMLQNMVHTNEYLSGMYIIGNNNMFFSSDWGVNQQKLREVYNIDLQGELVKNSYFTSTRNENYHFFSDMEVISLMIPVFSDKGEKIGLIINDLNSMYIEEILATSSASRNERVLVVNSENDLLYTVPNNVNLSYIVSEIPNISTLEKTTINKKVFGENSIIVLDSIDYTDWTIIHIISTEGIYEAINKLGFIFLAILLSLILLSFITTYRLSVSFTKPIVLLNEKIKQVEKGNMDASINVTSTDELGQLSRAFNNMVKKLELLIKNTVVEEKKKMEIEFQLLQSQINPHFLYNTLDSIKWLAVMQNVTNISEMITSLIHLLRYNVSNPKFIVTLEDEIKTVKNYVNIQKYRYGDTFSVSYDISNEAYSCCVLKFLLQPLIENAIYHGMEANEENGEIIIRAKVEEEYLIIEVEDNGPGMEEQVEDRVVSYDKKKMHSGIGLQNIRERIHLYFGSTYGLVIDSEKGKGTTIILYLPYKIQDRI
ncbi:sensor histidine kinase [Halalkalibacter flavus]|uniref:sensor histidine kinase n=1 Tax=Halalkalibacter flavus TaxID=3090668 RepID=UPI002FC6CA07